MKRIIIVSTLVFLGVMFQGNALWGQLHSLYGSGLFGVTFYASPKVDFCTGFEVNYEYQFSRHHAIGVKGMLIKATNRDAAHNYSADDGFEVDYKYRYRLGPGLGVLYQIIVSEGMYFETAMGVFMQREKFFATREANPFMGVTAVDVRTGSNYPGIKLDFLFGANSPRPGFLTNWTMGVSYVNLYPKEVTYLTASNSPSYYHSFMSDKMKYILFTTSLGFGRKW